MNQQRPHSHCCSVKHSSAGAPPKQKKGRNMFCVFHISKNPNQCVFLPGGKKHVNKLKERDMCLEC